jgi:hypothetical protein
MHFNNLKNHIITKFAIICLKYIARRIQVWRNKYVLTSVKERRLILVLLGRGSERIRSWLPT